jgi:hypothetical protein
MSRLARLAAVAVAVAAAPAAANPAGPGCVKIGETPTHLVYECVGERLPAVSPGQLVTDDERRRLRERIDALRLRKRRYQDQLRALDRLREGQERHARDLDGLTQQLIADASVHALSIVEEAVAALAGAELIPPASRAPIAASLTLTKASLQAVSSASAAPDDTQRRIDKAVDAVFTLKNLIEVNETLMSADAQKAFKRGLDTLPRLLRACDRAASGRSGWGEVLMGLDDVLDAGAQLAGPLKALRATAHIIDGEATMWMIRQDRHAIEGAFVSSQTARRFYLDRIGEVDQLLSFYEERVQRSKL